MEGVRTVKELKKEFQDLNFIEFQTTRVHWGPHFSEEHVRTSEYSLSSADLESPGLGTAVHFWSKFQIHLTGEFFSFAGHFRFWFLSSI